MVASEVRSLAQRSASAAREIKAMIGDSVERVYAGSKLVDEADATMGKIMTSVKQVVDLMSEIAAASQEQSLGIEQVNQAITQMDEVTQQNAALLEEAAAAAGSLEEQAVSLLREVGCSSSMRARLPRPCIQVDGRQADIVCRTRLRYGARAAAVACLSHVARVPVQAENVSR